jgi:antitoxin HicB
MGKEAVLTTEPTPSRSIDGLTSLDDFLAGEGKLEAFEAIAVKEVLAWQFESAMKAKKISRKRLAD